MLKEKIKKTFSKENFKNMFTGYNIIKIIVFIVFIAYAVSLLIPFLWMFLNMFKDSGEFNDGNVFGLPAVWKFSNIVDTFNFQIAGQSILSMFLTSIITTALGTIIHVMLSVFAAYAVAKYNFPGKKIILAVAIFTMIVPIVGTLPAQVRMMDTFNLNGSLLGVLFLYSGCLGFNFILLHSAFETISWGYAEAAEIDGANRFQILFRVMIPIAKGPIISVAILQIIALWNDYSTPFLFMNNQKTLAVGLQDFQTQYLGEKQPLVFTAIIISLLPILILFAIFEKTIMENTVAGGLKG